MSNLNVVFFKKNNVELLSVRETLAILCSERSTVTARWVGGASLRWPQPASAANAGPGRAALPPSLLTKNSYMTKLLPATSVGEVPKFPCTLQSVHPCLRHITDGRGDGRENEGIGSLSTSQLFCPSMIRFRSADEIRDDKSLVD